MRTRYLGTAILAIVLLGFLLAAVWYMVVIWRGTQVAMSGHGWFALSLGVFFSCVVGFGLMALMFFSSRRGYDDPPALDRPDQDIPR